MLKPTLKKSFFLAAAVATFSITSQPALALNLNLGIVEIDVGHSGDSDSGLGIDVNVGSGTAEVGVNVGGGDGDLLGVEVGIGTGGGGVGVEVGVGTGGGGSGGGGDVGTYVVGKEYRTIAKNPQARRAPNACTTDTVLQFNSTMLNRKPVISKNFVLLGWVSNAFIGANNTIERVQFMTDSALTGVSSCITLDTVGIENDELFVLAPIDEHELL